RGPSLGGQELRQGQAAQGQGANTQKRPPIVNRQHRTPSVDATSVVPHFQGKSNWFFLPALVPKLPFGNAIPRNSVSRAGNRVSRECVPKRSLGTRRNMTSTLPNHVPQIGMIVGPEVLAVGSGTGPIEIAAILGVHLGFPQLRGVIGRVNEPAQ